MLHVYRSGASIPSKVFFFRRPLFPDVSARERLQVVGKSSGLMSVLLIMETGGFQIVASLISSGPFQAFGASINASACPAPQPVHCWVKLQIYAFFQV